MSNSLTLKIGEVEITPLFAGSFLMSEKKIMENMPESMRRSISPKNARVSITAFLAASPKIKLLIDNGIGTVASKDISGDFSFVAPSRVMESLPEAGIKPEEITHVVLTHRHFDHICGCSILADAKWKPAFPNARYFMQKGEWEICMKKADSRSYIREQLIPVKESGQLVLIEGESEIAPGIRCRHTGGHSEHHQIVYIESQGEKFLHPGDLISRTAYAGYNSGTGYNFDHETARNVRRELIEWASRENAALAFAHDERISIGRIVIPHGCVEIRPVRRSPAESAQIKVDNNA